MYTRQHPEDLEDWLDALTFVHRASVCSSTGFSPFFMMYGRHPSLPLDAVWGADMLNFKSHAHWVKHMANVIQTTFRDARDRQLKTEERNRKRRDRNRYEVGFEPGDEVFYWEKAYKYDKSLYRPTKLESKYTGPHRVLRRIGHDMYECEHRDRRPGQNIFRTNVTRLVPRVHKEYNDGHDLWYDPDVGLDIPTQAPNLVGQGRTQVVRRGGRHPQKEEV